MLEKTMRGAAHAAWMASYWSPYRSVRRAQENPAAAQATVVERMLGGNGCSGYGRKFGLRRVGNRREFQSAIPIVGYDELRPWIERIKAGEQVVLTEEPVLMLEKTSGSSTAAKYIPYTSSLRREFQRALVAWMFDLHAHQPAMVCGTAYWAITPLAREPEITSGGLRVGFENDTEYLGAAERFLLRKILAVPEEVAHVPELDTALYVTLRFLLQSPSLSFISVLAPSFLTILLEHLHNNAERLLADLRDGALRPPRHLPDAIAPALHRSLRADAARARRLESARRESGLLGAQDLWRNLRVLSCWTGAYYRPVVPALRELFPGVHLQGKGLLATRGVGSPPLVEHGACIAAATSHFYEFIEQPGAAPRLLHELEANQEYSVLLTTGGGFYRYRLGDRLRGGGFVGCTTLPEV